MGRPEKLDTRGYGAMVARLTPDQKVGSSNLSDLMSSHCCTELLAVLELTTQFTTLTAALELTTQFTTLTANAMRFTILKFEDSLS